MIFYSKNRIKLGNLVGDLKGEIDEYFNQKFLIVFISILFAEIELVGMSGEQT